MCKCRGENSLGLIHVHSYSLPLLFLLQLLVVLQQVVFLWLQLLQHVGYIGQLRLALTKVMCPFLASCLLLEAPGILVRHLVVSLLTSGAEWSIEEK